jgi:uncharacterized protein YdaU (DUF1376 family)
MSNQPFLPLFFGDLLAATPTWSGEERALYVVLLAYQWTAGPLPKDARRIAKMAQYDTKNFLGLWEVVGTKFRVTDAGLINDRLEQHREKAKAVSKKRATAGQEGAAKRWQMERERAGKAMASAKVVAIGKAMANGISLSTHPSQPNQEGREEAYEGRSDA